MNIDRSFHKSPACLETKVVTIMTLGANKTFEKTEPEYFQYFVGILVGVTKEGVWLKQISNNCLSWFNMMNIISINEEQVLDPENEKDKETIDNIKNEIDSQKVSNIQNSENFDVDSLMDLASKANN